MYIMYFQYFMLLNLISFTFLSLFIIDPFILWFFLEMTNFMFICNMSISMNNKKMIFFYFIIQILASFLIIYSMITNTLIMKNEFIKFSIIVSLMLKLSIPPFHFWSPLIAKFLPWNLLLIMLTIQKIIPFYMLSNFSIYPMMINIIIILSSIIPPFMMFNLINMKMIMTYSSIHQSSWMILLIYMKSIIWIKYFLFYSIITFSLFYTFNKLKMSMTQYYLLPQFHKFKYINLLLILNLASLPPLSFFYMKWFSIYLFIFNSNLLIILIIMMFSSLIMLFIYTNLLINSLFMFKFSSKMIKFNLLNNPKFTPFMIFLTLLFSPILFII
uniref:NADH-ubiquinone oxidoreductase chain 2 n=1 Tax=Wasmannia auropunctata TaxID=64793 RepID=A0A191TFV8_WASAN|nr:NADH dehydrogenase subunit 2 [Wasmannia auropunctata]ANI87499.1 NADH dehydrogenase subunit 2 [Wasmannia auropunctata]